MKSRDINSRQIAALYNLNFYEAICGAYKLAFSGEIPEPLQLTNRDIERIAESQTKYDMICAAYELGKERRKCMKQATR